MTGARGFTLVELLVAITILGILMGVAFGSVRIGGKSLAAGVARADASEDLRASGDFLRRRLAELVPTTWKIGDEDSLAFAGTRAELVFVTPSPAAMAGSGLMLAKLAFEQVDDGMELWFGAAGFDPGLAERPPFHGLSKTRLLGDLATGRISYFGQAGEGGEPEWRDAWPQDAQQLPGAVRLDLVTRGQPPEEHHYLLRIPTGHAP